MIALSPLQSVRDKLEPCSRAIPRENHRWNNVVKNASPDVVHDQLTLEFAQIMDVPKTNWQYQGGDGNLVVLFCWTIIRLRGNLVRIMLNAAAWPVCSLQSTLSSTAVYKGERLTQPTGVSVHLLKTQKSLVFMLTVTQLQWSWDRSFNNGCKMDYRKDTAWCLSPQNLLQTSRAVHIPSCWVLTLHICVCHSEKPHSFMLTLPFPHPQG